jgi:hypothetical protein
MTDSFIMDDNDSPVQCVTSKLIAAIKDGKREEDKIEVAHYLISNQDKYWLTKEEEFYLFEVILFGDTYA